MDTKPDNNQANDLVLLTAEDVGDLLQVDKSFVYKLAKSGLIRAIRFGPRCVRFHPSDLRSFIESRRISA